jgi:hypothetical protein
MEAPAMRITFALLVGFASTIVAGCSRPGVPSARIVNPKPAPEVVALNQQFPLYGASRGALPVITPIPEPPPVTQAARDLRAYYADAKKEPPWKASTRLLSSAELVQRAAAASYLRDLLDQALKDEQAGVVPWLASPFWDGGGTNPARSLRERIAAALAEAPPAPGAPPVVNWFLEHEKLTRLQGQALRAVTELQGPDADALILELATKPHPNVEVACAALAQVDARKINVAAEQLASLCQHHRTRLREAARALNAQRGFTAPPLFDPVRAVQSDPLDRLMVEIGRLLAEPVPVEAPLVLLSIPGAAGKPASFRGWLLEEDAEQWVLLTGNGRRASFSKMGDRDKTPTLSKVSIEDEVDRVARVRREGDKDFEFSSRGGFSGQFEDHAAGEYEALLAQWLFAGKRYEQAAAILLPALDTLILDSHLVDITRDRLGDWYGQEMLASFVGNRDYAKTERLAKRIVERFPGTRFHAEAVRLLDELPRRRDDFDALSLPTPQEWETRNNGLTRREQINFLCRRLRLLNGFQDGQPGGVWYGEAQYAEPCGISPDAAWGQRRGKTEVINPLVELAGPIPGGGIYTPAAQSNGMVLTVDDIPALAEHLREDWLLLAVSFHRDFSPSRIVHRTRPLLASLINRLARRQLCRSEQLDALTDKQRDEEITRIAKWAEANRDKDETALLLSALADALESGAGWYQVSSQTRRLTELKVQAAVPLLFRFVEAGLVQSFNYDIRVYCDKIDPGALDRLAHEALAHKDPKVRMHVALLALKSADRATALTVLGNGLESGEDILGETVSVLLEDKAVDSRTAALRVFKNRRLPALDARVRQSIVLYVTSAHLPDGLRFYLRLLETQGNAIDGIVFDRPVAEAAAEEVMDSFAFNERAVDEIKKRPTPPGEKIAAVKTWLREHIEKIEAEK